LPQNNAPRHACNSPASPCGARTGESPLSLHPQAASPLPEDTQRVARAAFPHGNIDREVADHLGTLSQDTQFAPLFPTRGQSADAPTRLALVTVLQFAEGLSDRQAAEAVRGRIDWKYVLGLARTNPGVDPSVLREFRPRRSTGTLEHVLLDTLLTQARTQGLLKTRGRQRPDSTHVLAAIRVRNRLERVGETLRAALNSLAIVAPAWIQGLAPSEWYDRSSSRGENSHVPKTDTARQA
jgi:transposase